MIGPGLRCSQVAPGHWKTQFVVPPTNHAVKVRTQCLMRETEEAAMAKEEAAENAERMLIATLDEAERAVDVARVHIGAGCPDAAAHELDAAKISIQEALRITRGTEKPTDAIAQGDKPVILHHDETPQ